MDLEGIMLSEISPIDLLTNTIWSHLYVLPKKKKRRNKNLHQTYRKKGQFCGYQMGGERANWKNVVKRYNPPVIR